MNTSVKMRLFTALAAAVSVMGAGLFATTSPARAAAHASPQAVTPINEVFLESSQQFGWCLNGTITSITLQKCNKSNLHQLWELVAIGSTKTGMYKNAYNGYCIHGTTTAIAPNKGCNSNDLHNRWRVLNIKPVFNGYTQLNIQNVYNHYCINGTLARVYPRSTCNSDLHERWIYVQEYSPWP